MSLYVDPDFDPKEEHTAYQWVSHGYVPRSDARFYSIMREYGRDLEKCEFWYYCDPDDVELNKSYARMLMRTAPRKRDNQGEGGWYDGRPWW